MVKNFFPIFASNGLVKVNMSSMSQLAVAQEIATQNQNQSNDDAFFVMNIDQVVHQHQEWKRMLPRVHPHYAVKCNNDPVLLHVLASLNCGFDCASKQEIEAVLQIEGVDADRIIYANPCKTRNYIKHAASLGVKTMTFDNVEELYKIQSIFPEAELVLRIAVSDPTAICPLNVKFGCDPESVAPDLLKAAAALKLHVIGVSFHVGSGCRDPRAFAQAIFHSEKLFKIGKECGHQMTLLDIGGGYPGFPSEEITFAMIASVVNEALECHFPFGSDVKIIAEPGRFYAASGFSLCCNIIAKTRTSASKITGISSDEGDGFMYYINDGVYGSFNCILYDHFQPNGTALFSEGKEVASSVWGPTCDGLDLVLPHCKLPSMKEGGWIFFENMGAYTCAAGSEFNGFPRPKVYYNVTEKILKHFLNDETEEKCNLSETEDEADLSVSDRMSSTSDFSSDGTDSS